MEILSVSLEFSTDNVDASAPDFSTQQGNVVEMADGRGTIPLLDLLKLADCNAFGIGLIWHTGYGIVASIAYPRLGIAFSVADFVSGSVSSGIS